MAPGPALAATTVRDVLSFVRLLLDRVVHVSLIFDSIRLSGSSLLTRFAEYMVTLLGRALMSLVIPPVAVVDRLHFVRLAYVPVLLEPRTIVPTRLLVIAPWDYRIGVV